MDRISPSDERELQRALGLARDLAAFASPNPAVGCVLFRDGRVLAEGAHRYDERDHAEIVALKRAQATGENVRGATAYVTLEPCAHHGRTGPCSDALIRAGIARCVVATVDPNPLTCGEGLSRMSAAGIDVALADPQSLVAQGSRRLNDAFAFAIRHGRPFVTLKAAVSVDGMLAPPPSSRRAAAPFWLTGPAARADVQRLRHQSDALLTGIGTVLADDPSLSDRTGGARRRPLLRVILDSGLRMPLDAQLIRSAAGDVLVAASENASTEREEGLRDQGVEVVRLAPAEASDVDLHALLAELQRRGIRSVLAEGGSALNGSLLRTGLADRVVAYISETELGAGSLPFAAGQPSVYALLERLSGAERRAFRHADHSSGEDVRISGYVHDPWSEVSASTFVPPTSI